MPSELVKKTGVRVDKNYIYFVDDNGNISRIREIMTPGKKIEVEVIYKSKINKESGYVYFINQQGNICRNDFSKYQVQKITKKKK